MDTIDINDIGIIIGTDNSDQMKYRYDEAFQKIIEKRRENSNNIIY
jgi:hypothetical protein